MGRGRLMIAFWVGSGMGRGVHFESYCLYLILNLHLWWTGGVVVIPSACCIVSLLDNIPLSCRCWNMNFSINGHISLGLIYIQRNNTTSTRYRFRPPVHHKCKSSIK